MLFRFLRQYFQDEEFEQTKRQLAELQSLLTEYRSFIERQKGNLKEEKDKVEPDFLGLLWGSIGVALAIAAQAFTYLPKPVDGVTLSLTTIDWIYLSIGIYMVLFVAMNTLFAVELTSDYASSKSNNGYRFFSISLATGVLVIVAGIVAIAWIVR